MPINSFLYPGAKTTPVYEVANSVRYNDDDSPSMTKASTTVTNDKKFTVSAWCKRTTLGDGSGNEFGIFSHISDSNNANKNLQFGFYQDHIYCAFVDGGSVTVNKVSTALYQDIGAWYHVMLAVDSTQGTAANRNRIYVNGTEVTSFSTDTNAGENETFLSTSCNITVGRYTNTSGSHFEFDGYLAEVVYIDGLQLTPSSFGEFDEDSPTIFKPIDVSGLTFGNNGFYLDFEDSSNLGNDKNGGTDLTEANLAATDQSTDTCTNNFATLNPIYATGAFTFSEGNLIADDKTTTSDKSTISTIGFDQGKWYLEFKIIDQGGRGYLGFTDGADRGLAEGDIRSSPAKWGMYMPAFSSSSSTSGTVNSNLGTATDNDIICFAFDADNGQLFMSKNGNIDTSSTATITGITTGNNFHFFINETASNADVSGYSINFGSPAYSISSGNSDANGYGNFEYAVPSGYYALNTKNLAEFG